MQQSQHQPPKSIEQRINDISKALWERSKSFQDSVGLLTQRVSRLEKVSPGTGQGNSTNSEEIAQLRARVEQLEAHFATLEQETLASRTIGEYGGRLLDALAALVGDRMRD